MPEGVHPYPRWEGRLRQGPSFPIIAWEEVLRTWNNQWARAVLLFVLLYGALRIATVSAGTSHTMENLADFLNLMRWAALAIAAVMAGPALLEDHRQGALELYHSRGVTRPQYLLGKVLAILGVSVAVMLLPGIVYIGVSYLTFDLDAHPDGWNWAVFGVLGYSLLWGATVAGLGLGLSAVSRSSRSASLILFGGIAGLDIIVSNLLEAVTRSDLAQLLSPMAAMRAQNEWLFNLEPLYDWPAWYGLVELIGLAVVGWALVAWKHPRIRGEERGRD